MKEAHGTNGVTLSCCHYGGAPFAMQKDRREWRSVRFTALGGQATRVAESVHSSLVKRREKERAMRLDETGFTRARGDTIVHPL